MNAQQLQKRLKDFAFRIVPLLSLFLLRKFAELLKINCCVIHFHQRPITGLLVNVNRQSLFWLK